MIREGLAVGEAVHMGGAGVSRGCMGTLYLRSILL